MEAPEFFDVNGDLMVPLRCQSCGEQIGVASPGVRGDEEWLVARCYACAAVEEAEKITKDAA
jgi:hypothetical protein